jgi:hypothetical protein
MLPTPEEISVAQDSYMEGSNFLLEALELYFYLSFYGAGDGFGVLLGSGAGKIP